MKKIERTAIIGAGCLGIMFGGLLANRYGRENVYFIADSQRIMRYKKDGIICNGEKCDFIFKDKDSGGAVDLIIFANKFTTIDAAIDAAEGFAGPDTILISIINGIASEEIIGKRLGDSHLLYCVVHGMDSTRRGNEITYNKTGTIVFGDRENRKTEDVLAVEAYLDGAGIDYVVPDDIRYKMWSKLMFNVGINQVAAVSDCGYGGTQRQGDQRKMLLAAMCEARTVAAFEGVNLTDGDVDEWLDVLDGLTPEGMPSMQQDILAGRKTEVELFSGTIRKLGAKYNTPTPVNDFLYKEIKRLEEK